MMICHLQQVSQHPREIKGGSIYIGVGVKLYLMQYRKLYAYFDELVGRSIEKMESLFEGDSVK